ncbi:MAG: D-aminoacyl-tRNA deacylase [Chitinophagaceae bacterium]
MRAVIQRVSEASVVIEGEITGSIKKGLLVLLGIEEADFAEDSEWLIGKISKLRIFDDQNGVMNLSLAETGGEVLVVSQFTLHASTKKGNRPSYLRAAKPELARIIYEEFVAKLSSLMEKPVATGRFQAMMQVRLVNDGPVTILIDTKNRE